MTERKMRPVLPKEPVEMLKKTFDFQKISAVLPKKPASKTEPKVQKSSGEEQKARLQQREAHKRAHLRKQLLTLAKPIGIFCVAVLLLVLILHGCESGKDAPAQQEQQKQQEQQEQQTSEEGFFGPIQPAPQVNWEAYTMTDADQTSGSLALVNAAHTWVFPESQNLVSVYERKNGAYSLSGADLMLAEQAMEPLNQMIESFRSATGHSDLLVTTAYRSFDQQQKIYQDAVDRFGEGAASEYAAKPGEAELHTGLTVDFQTCLNGVYDSLHNVGDYAWLYEHSAEFGFVNRYPLDKAEITGVENSERSFRYVGKPHAAYMKENNLCLEEYLDLLRRHPWDGEHLVFDKFEIYFCSGRTVYVQEGWQFTVSGINGDGFVVAAWQN